MKSSTIFEITRAEGYDLCFPVPRENFAVIGDLLRRKQTILNWAPFAMEIVSEDEDGREWNSADAPWYGHHALILRPKAVLALSAFLKPYGQFLPLVCENANVTMFNVTRVIPALDEEASDVACFPDGSVLQIRRHVFRREVVDDVDLFKLTTRGGSIYVSQRFVDLWNSHWLTGLMFKRVWIDH